MSSTWAFGGIDRGLDGQHLIVGRPLPRRYIFSIRLGSRGVKAQPTGCLDSVLAYVIQHGSQQDSKAHQLLLGMYFLIFFWHKD